MAVAEGKKRYYLTINESNMEQFKSMLKEFAAPDNTESILIDEFVLGMVQVIGPVIRSIRDSGREPTMVDFFQLVVNQMRSLQDEQLSL